MAFIMVLNDEETYTNLDGCMIIQVPDDFNASEIDLARSDIHVITVFSSLASHLAEQWQKHDSGSN